MAFSPKNTHIFLKIHSSGRPFVSLCGFIVLQVSSKCNTSSKRAFKSSRCIPNIDSNAIFRVLFYFYTKHCYFLPCPSHHSNVCFSTFFTCCDTFTSCPYFIPILSELNPWAGKLCTVAVSELLWELCRCG